MKILILLFSASLFTSAEFERASNALMCLAYESENKAYLKEAEMMRSVLNTPLLLSLQPYDVLNGRAVKSEYPNIPRYYGWAGMLLCWLKLTKQEK